MWFKNNKPSPNNTPVRNILFVSITIFVRSYSFPRNTRRGFWLIVHNGCMFIHYPCFLPAMECQQGRCQWNADLRHFGNENTGTIYSTTVKYDMYFILPEIIHLNDQRSKSQKNCNLTCEIENKKSPKWKDTANAAVHPTSSPIEPIIPHLTTS